MTLSEFFRSPDHVREDIGINIASKAIELQLSKMPPCTPEMLKQQRIGVVAAETGLPRDRVEAILRENGSI